MNTKSTSIVFLLVIIFMSQIATAQVTFHKTFGSSGLDIGNGVCQTSDGGYILTGFLEDIQGDLDIFLIRLNANGDTLWTKTYVGAGDDIGSFVQQTIDGGFIITGYSSTLEDIILLKIDMNGGIEWTKSYGGTGLPSGEVVIQTADSGFCILGGDNDFRIIKTDGIGDTLWTKTYDNPAPCRPYFMQQTSDNGFIVTGYAEGPTTGADYFLLKLDANGDSLWCKTYGGTFVDRAYCVTQTADGGYLLGGYSASFGTGNDDMYLIKTDSTGNVLWSNTYGGIGEEVLYSMVETNDGGFILAGKSNSCNLVNTDAYIIKTDVNGTVVWSKIFGDAGEDVARSVQQTSDGGYIFTGYSDSFNSISMNIYLVKTDANGNSGCYESNCATVATPVSTITGNPGFTISSGATSTPQVMTVGNAFPFTTLCSSTGITEINNGITIIIYPNPFTEKFIVEGTQENGIVFLYDITGKEILQQPSSNNSTQINTKLISPGVYILNYVRENSSVMTKVVKSTNY